MNDMRTDSVAHKVATCLEALKADKVLSVGQIRRHYGISPRDLPAAIKRQRITIEPTARSRPAKEFVVCHVYPKEIDGSQARHACGTAEIRHELKIAPELWTVSSFIFGRNNPDAVFRSARGLIAIEFDAGAYKRTRVQTHAVRFGQSYVDQIWAVPTERRMVTVQTHLREIGINAKVIPVQWF